jgi:hypothetical protein
VSCRTRPLGRGGECFRCGSDDGLGDASVGVGDVEAVLFDVVQALVGVYAGGGLVAGELDGLEAGPGGELLGEIGAGGILGESEYAAWASEYVKKHR